jgi:hypothetical protein
MGLLWALAIAFFMAAALVHREVDVVVADPCPSAKRGTGLFDDFAYPSRDALVGHGWEVRSGAGGPGPKKGQWKLVNVAMGSEQGVTFMRLVARAEGTGEGASQSEVSFGEYKFLEGTYQARIRFRDSPDAGPDTAQVVQTFFAISPLAAPLDPTYSELDFTEYLPNGGWGDRAGPTRYQTSWHTYRPDPWYSDNVSNSQDVSLQGWHTISATVSAGVVNYYVDGLQQSRHTGKFYPRQSMTIGFNQWFVGTEGGPATWFQDVDYIYHSSSVMPTSQVTARVSQLRACGAAFLNGQS